MKLPVDLSDHSHTGSFNRVKPTEHGGWLVPLWAIPRASHKATVEPEPTKKENQDGK